MMLLTKANREQLPPLYTQDEKADDAIAFVKFVDPCGKTLMATVRSRRVSLARYTSPMPPSPILAVTR